MMVRVLSISLVAFLLAAAPAFSKQGDRGDDIQAPRSHERIQAPVSEGEVQAPRGQDVQAPRGQDIQAPRGQQR